MSYIYLNGETTNLFLPNKYHCRYIEKNNDALLLRLGNMQEIIKVDDLHASYLDILTENIVDLYRVGLVCRKIANFIKQQRIKKVVICGNQKYALVAFIYAAIIGRLTGIEECYCVGISADFDINQLMLDLINKEDRVGMANIGALTNIEAFMKKNQLNPKSFIYFDKRPKIVYQYLKSKDIKIYYDILEDSDLIDKINELLKLRTVSHATKKIFNVGFLKQKTSLLHQKNLLKITKSSLLKIKV